MPPTTNPLNPSIIDNPARYDDWRACKLAHARHYLAQPFVEIQDAAHLRQDELAALHARVEAMNFALYRINPNGGGKNKNTEFSHDSLKHLCRQLGLQNLGANPFSAASGISEIRPATHDTPQAGYIPYSNRALNWHTDGYYNPPDQRINAFAMHTIHAAADGGENRFLDHEILYLLLRDKDPALAACLFADDVMHIPPGTAANATTRAAQTGPVFLFAGGHLQMRFTLRRRHIHWKDSETVQTALTEINSLLNDPDNPFIVTQKLRAGEGVISNNILHNRAAFVLPADGQPQRLVLRARFYDRINIPASVI